MFHQALRRGRSSPQHRKTFLLTFGPESAGIRNPLLLALAWHVWLWLKEILSGQNASSLVHQHSKNSKVDHNDTMSQNHCDCAYCTLPTDTDRTEWQSHQSIEWDDDGTGRGWMDCPRTGRTFYVHRNDDNFHDRDVPAQFAIWERSWQRWAREYQREQEMAEEVRRVRDETAEMTAQTAEMTAQIAELQARLAIMESQHTPEPSYFPPSQEDSEMQNGDDDQDSRRGDGRPDLDEAEEDAGGED